MMNTAVLLALFSALCPNVAAQLQLKFARQETQNTAVAARRDPGVMVSSFWAELTYVVNVTVGTPGQPVSLILSPSSSDTWVVDTGLYYCTYYDSYSSSSSSSTQYCTWGTFSPENSTSFQTNTTVQTSSTTYSSEFYASYSDGTYASGEYMNDVITFGGVLVPNLSMGLVNNTDHLIGVLGIGYNDSSSNLPDRLVEQGLINSTAYSICVDDEQASSGNLLFGAVDTSKFDGNLTRINLSGYGSTMSVDIYAMNATTDASADYVEITYDSGNEYSYMFTAVISPPDTVSRLPTEVAEQIWGMAGAYFDDNIRMAVIECSAASNSSIFSLQLGDKTNGPIISAMMEDLVIPVDNWDTLPSYSYSFDEGDYLVPMCLFGVQNITSYHTSSYSSMYNLGSSLLRRTYTVFDLVNDEVAIAPVKFNSTGSSNVIPFQSYGAKTPSATQHCTANSCKTATTFPYGGDSGSASAKDLEGTVLPGILSLGALLGIVLGLGLGSLALGILGFCLWRRRSAKKN